ncbi:hypothetical protein AVEN_229516-1 [Araneus ventricosus]|uniref:Uncharacterized protein n=1 Tax=Araneus ventricosus TaxID=182803 RepID=A0A4Y2EGS0_ARAVE|nr:hypothetical protein AVEN_229516-1 [Araneus ventricosus]
MALEFARRGGAICLTGGQFVRRGGTVSPTRGHDLLYEGIEIGFKFSPYYYLSTTVECPVQKFSPTGFKIFPRRGAQHPRQGALDPPVPPLEPPLCGRRKRVVVSMELRLDDDDDDRDDIVENTTSLISQTDGMKALEAALCYVEQQSSASKECR